MPTNEERTTFGFDRNTEYRTRPVATPTTTDMPRTAPDAGKERETGLLGGIQERISAGAQEQKNRAADGLGGVAQVFRNAGNELRTENETLASYVDMASDSLKRMADHVRDRGVTDMMDDLQHFARRRPAVFIGGAFLIGLGVTRFLKSSAEPRPLAADRRGMAQPDPMRQPPAMPRYDTTF